MISWINGGQIEHIKIGVSGSAAGDWYPSAPKKAEEIGYHLAKKRVVLVTGDTTGMPAYAAQGAQKAGGFVVGISPAYSALEHAKKYRLLFTHTDFTIYTGFGYSGRNLLFIRSCDAMIFICGRIGTLNEFTIAFEDHKPMGVLLGTGGMTDEIQHILDVSKRGEARIVFDDDPKRLVEKVLKMVTDDRQKLKELAKNKK